METVDESWAAFMPHIFAQSLRGNPYSAIPPDMWIEMTMNKSLKSGWKYLLSNEQGLMVHITNMNNVTLVSHFLANLLCRVKCKHNSNISKFLIVHLTYTIYTLQLTHNVFFSAKVCHSGNTGPRRRKDEKAVQNLIALMHTWDCNPFNENQILRTLMSGEIASEQLVEDFKTAQSDGEKALNDIFTERLFSGEKSIYDRMRCHNRMTFANKPKEKYAIEEHYIALLTMFIDLRLIFSFLYLYLLLFYS